MPEDDKNAFLTVYRNYYAQLFRYGFSLTSDKELTKDSIQELFLEIWNARTDFKEVRNVRSYLFTWLRRRISRKLSLQTRQKYVEERQNVGDVNQSSYEELLIAFQSAEEKKEKLARALANLTRKQVEIIRLRFFENLSYEEIAAKTLLTTRTIYNLTYEAIHRLREEVSLPA